MIRPERIARLNDTETRRGDYVLYWMQASQREHYNHAVEHAVSEANRLGVPVVVGFGLTDEYPEANLRSYRFMLEGLRQTRDDLADRGIQLVVLRDAPPAAALALARRARMIVADRGYLRHQRRWRDEVADAAGCAVVEVETDAVVPVESASDKQEFAARTIRPKLNALRDEFLKPMRRRPVDADSLNLRLGGEDLDDIDALLERMDVDRGVGRVDSFHGGTARARNLLERFIDDGLGEYAERRSDPSLHVQSHMSPYLHFGHISPVWVALQVARSGASADNREAYLEELIVRRELSLNFVWHNPRYDRYDGLPDWARRTLKAHSRDRRPVTYTPRQLAEARTDDPYWNAAQREMMLTGKMHNYMRMYWGKKILEWSDDPRGAFELALELNNAWELDGRDPNSYAGVAWCFGAHDRPWAEREIFGTVRYMSAGGLERKFDIDEYVQQVDRLGDRGQ